MRLLTTTLSLGAAAVVAGAVVIGGSTQPSDASGADISTADTSTTLTLAAQETSQAATSVAATVSAAATGAQADGAAEAGAGAVGDGLAGACAAVPAALERVQKLQTKIAADADTKGSLAYLRDRIARADSAGRDDLASILRDRLDVRTKAAALLTEKRADLEKAEAICEAR